MRMLSCRRHHLARRWPTTLLPAMIRRGASPGPPLVALRRLAILLTVAIASTVAEGGGEPLRLSGGKPTAGPFIAGVDVRGVKPGRFSATVRVAQGGALAQEVTLEKK
jgi:hypothetical protein